MLEQSRLTLATALAIAAFGASPALAAPIDPVATGTGEGVASQDRSSLGRARRERRVGVATTHTAAPRDPVAPASGAGAGDQRTPDAVEPFVRPVAVATGEPASPGFDWTSAIIGARGRPGARGPRRRRRGRRRPAGATVAQARSDRAVAASVRQQLARVHDPGRIAALLDQRRSTSRPSRPCSASSHARWSRPTAWWWVIVAPAAAIASPAARLAARHCPAGSSRVLAREHGEVERRAVGIEVRDVAADDRRGGGERARERVAHRAVQRRERRPARRGLERLDQHAAIEQRVAQVRAGEPRGAPRLAGAAAERQRAAAQPPGAPRRGAARRPRPRPPSRRSAGSPAGSRARQRGRRPLRSARPAGERERRARLVLVGEPRDVRRRLRPARARAAPRSPPRTSAAATPRSGAPPRPAGRGASAR